MRICDGARREQELGGEGLGCSLQGGTGEVGMC